jgi:hypothetical protein
MSESSCTLSEATHLEVAASPKSSHLHTKSTIHHFLSNKAVGWRHLHYEQGILHVLLLVKHLRTPGTFQSLLLVNLNWYQVIAGVSFSPLQFPEKTVPYLDHAWLDSTRQFLKHDCSAQIEIPKLQLPSPQRVNDSCIMEAFLKLKLSPTSLRRQNFCRLWLQVTHMSDISTLQGNKVDRSA